MEKQLWMVPGSALMTEKRVVFFTRYWRKNSAGGLTVHMTACTGGHSVHL